MFKPRDYQIEISGKAAKILNTLNIVYLAMEVRTGKTFTALMTCELVRVTSVLFITTKKAISSIENDYNTLSPSYEMTTINFESLHKLAYTNFDVIIVDEAHKTGAFPKPSLRTKRIKEIAKNKRIILLSGTPTAESYSQIYHQFWISSFSPFTETNFYKWANNYVDIKKVYRAHGQQANDYSFAKENLIRSSLSKYMISYTQKQAGFKSKVDDNILVVPMRKSTYELANILRKDLVFVGKKGGVILADTPVKLLQKTTQIYSGTIKLEDGTAVIIDTTKADFIKRHFKGKKIAIFYVYKEELKLLQQTFLEKLTTDISEFDNSNKNIALQVVSGREGISLRNADCLVMFNIQHSAVSYWQSRDRMTTKERLINNVYWVFSKNGIEQKIYETVMEKKSFTTKHFKNHYDGIKIPIEAN